MKPLSTPFAALLIFVAAAASPAAELDLGARVLPLPEANRFKVDGFFVWCGAPVKGPDGKFHLFYSRWPVSVGFAPGWAIHSEIAHAVADKPEGPYAHVNVALPPRGVNPATGLVVPYTDGRAGMSEIIFTDRQQFVSSATRKWGEGSLRLALGYAQHKQDSFYEKAIYKADQTQYYLVASTQQPLGETRAEARMHLVHPVRLQHVDPDAVDHRRAASINDFISRTAGSRPVNTARATIAWPMFSSTICGMAATGCTFW